MKLHHIGIVVNDLEKTAKMMNEFFNNNDSKILSNKIQKVNYCFIDLGQTKIELIEPTSTDSPIADFLNNHDNGYHHLAFEVNNIEESISKFISDGSKLIAEPSIGFENRTIAFIFTRTLPVQLIELVSKKPMD
tara:strand:- start:2867 stop:3268 length:402 start_codon:yes stop_codon:yes gene_type:complete